MSKYTVLILDSTDQLNVSIQHSFVTLSELKVIHGKIILEDILHVDCCLRGVTRTEGIKSVHDAHVKINSLRLK